MEIHLIYILKALILPPSVIILLMLLSYIIGKKSPKIGNRVLLATASAFYLFSLPVVSSMLAEQIEIYPPLKFGQLSVDRPQAIVVLGGGMHQNAREYINPVSLSNRTLLRLRYSAFLAKGTLLPLMVVGGKVFDQDLPSEGELMENVLQNEYGINVRWRETKSRNTAQNANFSYKQLARENIDSIILVTHARHMPRAVKQFEQAGFKVTPAPMAFISQTKQNEIFDYLPNAGALALNNSLLHEVLGQWWYSLRYN